MAGTELALTDHMDVVECTTITSEPTPSPLARLERSDTLLPPQTPQTSSTGRTTRGAKPRTLTTKSASSTGTRTTLNVARYQ